MFLRSKNSKMPLCSVITCKFSQEEYNPSEEGIVFHRFPTNQEIRAKWVDMTGLDDWVPTSKDHICSRHFRDNDYFIKRSGKRYLKTAAIPCEYVVYRHLFPDEEVADIKIEVDEDDPEEASAHQEQEPKVVVIHEPEQEDMQLADQPGPSFHNMQLAASDQLGPRPYGIQLADPEQADPSRYGIQLVDLDQPGPSRLGMQLAAPDEPGPSRYDMQVVDPMPGPSHGFAPGTSRNHSNAQVPDSTIATIYDNQNMRDWDRFRPERYFGQRLPSAIFDDTSQEVDSSGFVEHYGRDEEALMEELDLRPHLQQLPPPRTPEPVLPDDEPEHSLNSEPGPRIDDLLDIPIPSPIVEILRGQQKLQDIRKIITRRKSSRKAVAAALAEVIEAQKVKFEMQSREMNDRERADAIITLQSKRIAKLNMKYRRLKKTLKRISTVLRTE